MNLICIHRQYKTSLNMYLIKSRHTDIFENILETNL